MNILVTGCAGFIGSHLCEALLDAGHEVTGIDALTGYYDPRLKRRSLRRCMESPRFHFLPITISEVGQRVFRDAEVIYHLAAQPGVRASWGPEFETYVTNNVLSTQFLLEQVCDSENLKRFIYTSSSSVYGNTVSDKVSENQLTNPYSPYGVTKLAAEHLCSAYADVHGLPIILLRLFTVCGPRQRPDMMFHRLIHAALTGARFPMYGDGSMERDFTPVMDVVKALVLASETFAEPRVFNIGSGQTISLCQAIALVEDLCGIRIAIEHHEKGRGDVRRTSADISRAMALLKYQPTWTLRDAVGLHIADMEQLLREANPESGNHDA